MKIEKKHTSYYLVLVPHNETRLILKKYSDELIKNGLKGVYPFPFVAPLAELEKPLKPEELKKYSRELRKDMNNEKFQSSSAESMSFHVGKENLSLYGPRISPASSAPLRLCERLIIGCWLSLSGSEIFISPPKISFRACALANFYIKPIKNGFKWKIGNLYWLPKHK